MMITVTLIMNVSQDAALRRSARSLSSVCNSAQKIMTANIAPAVATIFAQTTLYARATKHTETLARITKNAVRTTARTNYVLRRIKKTS